MGYISKYIHKVRHFPNHAGKDRAKRMDKLMQTECFRQCGIVPADLNDRKKLRCITVPDPHMHATMQHQLYHGHPNALVSSINGRQYYRVYTDGSCLHGTNKNLARAGWGVYYHKDSEHNCHFPLNGPVQSSYRAEIKALLHVLRTSAIPTIVFCDCKSVVNIFNAYIQGSYNEHSHLIEQDLWLDIFHLVDRQEPPFIKVQWMPAHLDEKEKVKQRDAAIAAGIVTQEDIDGNVAADLLAKKGAEQHDSNGQAYLIAQDARRLAIVVHKMQAHIWELFVQSSHDDVACADTADSSYNQHIPDPAIYEHEGMYDYDPFCDTEVPSGTQDSDEERQATTDHACLTLQQKYPDYGWNARTGEKDAKLQICIPDDDAINNLHRNGKQTVANVTSPFYTDAKGIQKQRSYKSFYIPPHWWEPVAWWFANTVWSVHGIKNTQGKASKQAQRTTWSEIVVIFQCITGFRFPHRQLDFHSQERILRFMLQRTFKNVQVSCSQLRY